MNFQKKSSAKDCDYEIFSSTRCPSHTAITEYGNTATSVSSNTLSSISIKNPGETLTRLYVDSRQYLLDERIQKEVRSYDPVTDVTVMDSEAKSATAVKMYDLMVLNRQDEVITTHLLRVYYNKLNHQDGNDANYKKPHKKFIGDLHEDLRGLYTDRAKEGETDYMMRKSAYDLHKTHTVDDNVNHAVEIVSEHTRSYDVVDYPLVGMVGPIKFLQIYHVMNSHKAYYVWKKALYLQECKDAYTVAKNTILSPTTLKGLGALVICGVSYKCLGGVIDPSTAIDMVTDENPNTLTQLLSDKAKHLKDLPIDPATSALSKGVRWLATSAGYLIATGAHGFTEGVGAGTIQGNPDDATKIIEALNSYSGKK
jgi:hypothetical protein